MAQNTGPAFVARIPDELSRSKPLNAGMSRLGGEPFHVTTAMYDRAADEGRRRDQAAQNMEQDAKDKKQAKQDKKASREDQAAEKAGKNAMMAEQKTKAEAAREEGALKKLEEELRKEDEIKAAKLKPKPGTQCIMRAVPKVVNLKDLKKMFENFGPVKLVKVIKLSKRSGDDDENAGVEGYVQALGIDVMTVGVTFGEHWVAKKALKSLGAKLEWNPCEDPIYTATTEEDAAHQPRKSPERRKKKKAGMSNNGKLPGMRAALHEGLKLPPVMYTTQSTNQPINQSIKQSIYPGAYWQVGVFCRSANQSLLVTQQREKALSGPGRPKTPVMNHEALMNQSCNSSIHTQTPRTTSCFTGSISDRSLVLWLLLLSWLHR